MAYLPTRKAAVRVYGNEGVWSSDKRLRGDQGRFPIEKVSIVVWEG